MRKVPPSVTVREQIDQALFSEGLDAKQETNLLSTLAQLGLSYLVQQALEQEQEDFLGRGHYERRKTEEQARRGYRNGYEEAGLATAEGKVEVRVPQVRGASEPYRSRLMEFLSGNSEALERLVVEMYARGLSTRDVEECFRDEDTGGPAVGGLPCLLREGPLRGRGRVPLFGRRLRVLETLRGQGRGIGGLVHHFAGAQGASAPIRGQQGVRELLGRLFEGHGGKGLEDPDLRYLRWGPGTG
jgi:hypothetical protein